MRVACAALLFLTACDQDRPTLLRDASAALVVDAARTQDASEADAGGGDAGAPSFVAVHLASIDFAPKTLSREVDKVSLSFEWPRFRTRPPETGNALNAIIDRTLERPASFSWLRKYQGSVEGTCTVELATTLAVGWSCRKMTELILKADAARGEGGSPGDYTRFVEVRWLDRSDLPPIRIDELLGPKAMRVAKKRIAIATARRVDCAPSDANLDLDTFALTAVGISWRYTDGSNGRCEDEIPTLAWDEIADPSPRLRRIIVAARR